MPNGGTDGEESPVCIKHFLPKGMDPGVGM